jgi:hypothetical protein
MNVAVRQSPYTPQKVAFAVFGRAPYDVHAREIEGLISKFFEWSIDLIPSTNRHKHADAWDIGRDFVYLCMRREPRNDAKLVQQWMRDICGGRSFRDQLSL